MNKFCSQVDSGFCVVLPGRDSSGRRVILNLTTSLNLDVHTNNDVMKVFVTTLEALMDDQENQIRGVSYLFNCKGKSK